LKLVRNATTPNPISHSDGSGYHRYPVRSFAIDVQILGSGRRNNLFGIGFRRSLRP
jgi:hypothetical protein